MPFTSKLQMRQLHYSTRGWACDLISAEYAINTNLTHYVEMNSNRLSVCDNQIQPTMVSEMYTELKSLTTHWLYVMQMT